MIFSKEAELLRKILPLSLSVKGGTGTKPSGNSSGRPQGSKPKNTSRGIQRQNETADILAKEGYKVTILEEKEGGNGYGIAKGSNPDLLVEDNVFDVYSPNTNTSVNNILRAIANKTKTQATRIILNLTDFGGDIENLYNSVLSKTNGDLKYLEELKVIIDESSITWFAK